MDTYTNYALVFAAFVGVGVAIWTSIHQTRQTRYLYKRQKIEQVWKLFRLYVGPLDKSSNLFINTANHFEFGRDDPHIYNDEGKLRIHDETFEFNTIKTYDELHDLLILYFPEAHELLRDVNGFMMPLRSSMQDYQVAATQIVDPSPIQKRMTKHKQEFVMVKYEFENEILRLSKELPPLDPPHALRTLAKALFAKAQK